MRWCRTSGAAITSWRLGSQWAGGWRSRSTSWFWRSDPGPRSPLQPAPGRLNATEPADLNLDASTIRFRQALTIIDPAVLPAADPRSSGRRRQLAVGPVKSTASSAILSLPPFAVQALRRHRRQQARLRLALGQPATVPLRWVEPGRPPRPVELDLVFRTERGTPVNPTTPAAPSPAWPPASGWPPTHTYCAMP